MKTGDKCPKCQQGRFFISKSIQSGDRRYQYRTLKCNHCKQVHEDKEIALAESVRRRA